MKKPYEAPVLVTEPVVMGVFGKYLTCDNSPAVAQIQQFLGWLFGRLGKGKFRR